MYQYQQKDQDDREDYNSLRCWTAAFEPEAQEADLNLLLEPTIRVGRISLGHSFRIYCSASNMPGEPALIYDLIQ